RMDRGIREPNAPLVPRSALGWDRSLSGIGFQPPWALQATAQCTHQLCATYGGVRYGAYKTRQQATGL
ncbi:MAG: hypothetical protein LBN24_00505, partial [Mediterranea sp.]|nr:hypothetical protein [Mediterranea sp.]